MRSKVARAVEQITHGGGRRALVESDVFNGCANKDRAAARRHEIASRAPYDTPERWGVGRELQQLPADGRHGKRRNTFDIDVPRPASCGNHSMLRGHAPGIVELDTEVAVSTLDAPRARGYSHPRAVLDGGGRQGPGQLGSDDKSVRLHKKSRGNVGCQLRFHLECGTPVEQLAFEAGCTRFGRYVPQLIERLTGGDDL